MIYPRNLHSAALVNYPAGNIQLATDSGHAIKQPQPFFMANGLI
ncbi:MAG: hypothetical protein R3E39_17170 [Anaerolineae bacterium]